jgi:hypothetical protein
LVTTGAVAIFFVQDKPTESLYGLSTAAVGFVFYLFRYWYKTKQYVSKNKKRRHSDIHFDISVEDIIIPKFCPYLGIELITDIKQSRSPFYISIDRIDPKKGYVKGNVQIISNMANRMKNNATIEQLILFSENVIKIHKGQNL